MSLYNLINGFSHWNLFTLPMLGLTQDTVGRFRDSNFIFFTSTMETSITVLTRMGGGNREDWADEIRQLQEHPNYERDYDMDDDNTYAVFDFSVPDEFESDAMYLGEGKFTKLSKSLIAKMRETYPILNDKGVIDAVISEDRPVVVRDIADD